VGAPPHTTRHALGGELERARRSWNQTGPQTYRSTAVCVLPHDKKDVYAMNRTTAIALLLIITSLLHMLTVAKALRGRRQRTAHDSSTPHRSVSPWFVRIHTVLGVGYLAVAMWLFVVAD
jgi:hypothetical protein